ncbi:MAG: prepilin-type N-terminal cleavage/methylation domain-containing protein [Patescibacteria group bacterium]
MIFFNIKSNKMHSRGYTLIELLFYVALFAVLTLTVINAMYTMTKAFRETSVQRELANSSTIMERITREIRQANAVNSISSTDLKLDTTDDVGTAKKVEFLLSGTNLQLKENDVLTGNLNSPTISVTAVSFSQITTTKGVGIKITYTVKSNNDALGRTADFYDSVVLRGYY